MNLPFWRCAIICLLLGALPAQWLAAATTLPCAGHPVGVVHKVSKVASTALTVTSHHAASNNASGTGALVAAHQDGDGAGHDHEILAGAHTSTEAHAHSDPNKGHDGAQAHPQAKCASAGHCCLSAALVSTPTLPDFAQRNGSADFATLAQHHRAPVLSGPKRPPRFQAA